MPFLLNHTYDVFVSYAHGTEAEGRFSERRHNLLSEWAHRFVDDLVEGMIRMMDSADGVVVVRREEAAEVARLAGERFAKAQKSRERLKAGELGVDFYGLRAKLAELGVRYVDDLESNK